MKIGIEEHAIGKNTREMLFQLHLDTYCLDKCLQTMRRHEDMPLTLTNLWIVQMVIKGSRNHSVPE